MKDFRARRWQQEDRNPMMTVFEKAGRYPDIIDLSIGSMVMELTGEPEKIDGFLDVLSPYKILEMCRTGITALERGGVHRHA